MIEDERTDRWRSRLRAVFILCLLFNAVAYFSLPAEMAVHFAGEGRANGWVPSWLNLLLFGGLDILLFVFFWWGPDLILRTPARWVNLPRRDVWLAEENRDLTRLKLRKHLSLLGIGVFLFMLGMSALILKANYQRPPRLNTSLFLVVLVFFLLYVGVWVILFYLDFSRTRRHGAG